MELKDAGMKLRVKAQSWQTRMDPDAKRYSYLSGRDDASEYCGKSLDELLDKCGVPQLEIADE